MTDTNPITELQRDRNRLATKAKLRSIEKDIGQITAKLNSPTSAISAVADKGYTYASSYTALLEALAKAWRTTQSQVESALENFQDSLVGEVADVDGYLDVVRGGDNSGIAPAKREIRDLKSKIEDAERQLAEYLEPIEVPLEQMKRQLDMIDWSLNHWEEITADLENGENLIMAADAEWDDGGDKPDGILYLTNKRLIFEQKEKTGKFLGMFGGKKVHEIEWTMSLRSISNVRAEDTGILKQNDMLYLSTSEGEYSLEIKGKSDNDEWLPYINAVKNEQFIIGNIPLNGAQSGDNTPTVAIEIPQANQAMNDASDSDAGAIPIGIPMSSSNSNQPPSKPPSGGTSDISDILPNFQWLAVSAVNKTVTKTIPGYAKEGIAPRTVHETISAPAFKIAQTAITNEQWQAFMDAPDGYNNWDWWTYATDAMQYRRIYPYGEPNPGANRPRTGITYYDAIAFCRWISHRTGENIILPNEGEYEHARQELGSELAKHAISEFTITHFRDDGESLIRSVTSRAAVGHKRMSFVNNTAKKELGFRIVQLDGRTAEIVKPRLSVDKLLDTLENWSRPTMPKKMPSEAYLIALYQDAASIPRLIQMLSSETSTTRGGAITALMWMAQNHEIPIQPILDYIHSETETLPRDRALRTLMESGSRVIEPVKAQLKDNDPIVRRAMIGILATLDLVKGIEVEGIEDILKTGIQDADHSVAKVAISWVHELEAKPELVALLQEKGSNKHLTEQVKSTLDKWGVDAEITEPEAPEPIVFDPDLKSQPTKEDVIPTVTADTDSESLLPNIEWVNIPKGTVTIKRDVRVGRHETKTKHENFDVDTDARIQTEPVTIEQFQVFLDEAYDNRRWWEYSTAAMGDRSHDFREVSGKTAYQDNVNFWTAQAYAFWVSARTGVLHRLPYEDEWTLARDENAITVPEKEWVVARQNGYKVPTYSDNLKPVIRTKDDKYRSEKIPLGREDDLCFRLVETSTAFEKWVVKIPSTSVALKRLESSKSTSGLKDIIYDLALTADEEVIPTLLDQIDAHNGYALYSLYWMSDRIALPVAPLVESLTLGNPKYTTVVRTLGTMGEVAIDPLQQATQSPDAKLRERALLPLRQIMGEDAMEILLGILTDDAESTVRKEAARQLGMIGTDKAIAALKEYSRYPDARVATEVNRILKLL